jgi:hypothetical protein
VIAADTSSAAGAATAVVWLAAAAFALRSADPRFCKFPLAADTMSGATLSNDIMSSSVEQSASKTPKTLATDGS